MFGLVVRRSALTSKLSKNVFQSAPKIRQFSSNFGSASRKSSSDLPWYAASGLIFAVGSLLIYKNNSIINQENDQINLFTKLEAEAYSDDINTPSSQLPIIESPLVFAPNVPPPINRKHRAVVKVNMSASMVVSPIRPGLNYQFWTFDGHVPGPFIRARVGDILDVSLANKDDSGMMHNVDFHAVTGPGGGAGLLTAETEETKRAEFKLLQPGLYVYHCAVGPVPVHVGNGMYGLILVEPKEGLPKVDKEFYVFQSDFYYYPPAKKGSPKVQRDSGHGHSMKPSSQDSHSNKKNEEEEEEQDHLDFCYEDGLLEKPSAVVFNGREGSLTKENTLQVNQGERVRIMFGNGGPNLVSSFHVIGAIFDKVYREGDLISPPGRSIQTTLVPAGGATVVEFDAIVPGNYTIVDHSLFRLEKGAVGFINVNGKPTPDIYHSIEKPKNCPNCKIHP